ncbi:MAG: MBL fold metallo-hydrolase [Saprospiraceae bacterium]|nr:MBL fold metallo-hydrolase [Saprospiraceae bacterium]
MKITPVEAGRFKLDGGAMFGVVPKRMWNRLNPSDDENMCSWTMRSILIEYGQRKVLVDTGIGFKQGEKFRSHFYPHGAELEDSLDEILVRPEEITDVFITHFHFDHVGGALKLDDQGRIVPAFPNATYWSNEVHYDWACDPNPREAASFLKENFVPLKEQGELRFIDVQKDDLDWMDGIRVRTIYGHTKAQMILFVPAESGTVVYSADLIPSSWHIRLPYIMAYDMKPMVTLEEKQRLLDECIHQDLTLFFEHDPVTISAKVAKDDRSRYHGVSLEKDALDL